MAGALLPTLLLLLLPLALRSAGQEAQDTGERIINGDLCPRGAQPWQVALYHNNTLNCAGVLVNQQWVLTVAHCRTSDYIVQMGSDLVVDGRARNIRATESFVHPRYNKYNYDHDLMLVRLSSRAKLSPNVQTINIPSSCKAPGTSCTVSGWGVTNMEEGTKATELMCSNVNLISYQECKVLYPTLLKNYKICAAPPDRLSYCCRIRATESFVHPWYNKYNYDHDLMLVKLSSRAKLSANVQTINIPSSCKAPGTSCTVSGWGVTNMEEGTKATELMCSNVNLISYQECKVLYPTLLKNYKICAAPPDRLSYCCRGDSGNPLICQGSLQGLMSTGYYPCIPPFQPVIYTRICMYRKWIYETMRTNS